MKKIRFLSALLCLALLVTTLAAPALADDNSSSGLVLNKTAVYNADNKDYTITLEAYATGSKVISTVNKDVPTDIVLVLDQSGSMKDGMGDYVEYTDYSNSSLYRDRYNGGTHKLLYKLEDGSYVTVLVNLYQTLGDLVNYKTGGNGEGSQSKVSPECYWYHSDNLYECVNGKFVKVKLTQEETSSGYTFTYTFENGDVVPSEGNNIKPSGNETFKKHMPLYATFNNNNNNVVYAYTYTIDGEVYTIGTSQGANGKFTETLYYYDEDAGTKKLDALKTAVTTFVNSVNTKAKGADGEYGTADDINHRIAVVGFGTGNTDKATDGHPKYENTELFIGKNQYNYNVNASSYYSSAFQDMSTEQGYENVIASNNELASEGATQVDLGVKMANGIFGANPIDEKEKRNRVMIVFTDGAPSEWTGYSEKVAVDAIDQANTTKNTHNATVYTIGIFSGADATSSGDSNGTETEKANWFMQNLSSNNGTPQSPSYYLSAADASSLNNIFKRIAEQIQGGSVSTTLGSSTVIKDIIAPQFELPDGTDTSKINVYTAECNGVNEEGVPQFKEECESATDVHISITGSVEGSADTVSVTGFDFSENWCGAEINNGATTYRGKKLIIEFTVKAKDAFLGGNDVYTNTSAGVYANDEATEPVQEFNRPQVNVPIKDVTVTAADKNVYLLGSLTAEQIKSGATVACGNVTLMLGAENYGLASWQNEYVTIDVTYTDADGNAVTDMGELKDDKTYSITATVTPKTITPTTSEGVTAVTKTGSATQKINVFKPELTVTFKDNTVDYKSSIDSTSYVSNKATLKYTENNLVSATEVWKHDGTDSTAVTMIGEEPTLGKTYTYSVSEGVESGKVTSMTYVPVKAVVATSINGTSVTNATKITFAHQCEVNGTDKDGNKISCEYWNAENMKDGDPAFLLHVENIYADLTITKTFAEDVTVDEGQSFLFHVSGPDFNGDVIIVGSGSVTIKDLTIGKYTVTEDTGWSWRYTPVENGKSITLVANEKNEVTIENRRDKEQWLDGNTHADNLFKADGIDTTTGAATN